VLRPIPRLVHGVIAKHRQDLLDALDGLCMTPSAYFSLPLSCGSRVTYQTREDVPDASVPCPCGQSGAWAIRYQQEAV